MEWFFAVLALLSSFTGNVRANEVYVLEELTALTGIEDIPEYRYGVGASAKPYSWADDGNMFLARPSMREFRHELVHVRLEAVQPYSPHYHEAVAEYIATKMGEYSHPYERLSNYQLTPLVCAGHIPLYTHKGGNNTWYAYQVWNLALRQQQLARDKITMSEFYEAVHIAYWLEAYRAVCTD